MLKKNKGFTLIELLVVIAIIGILSSVVITSLNSTRQKARDSRRQTDLRNIQLAGIAYADDQATFSYDFCDGAGGIGAALATYFPSGAPTDPSSAASYTCYSDDAEFCINGTLERGGLFGCDEDQCRKFTNAVGCSASIEDVKDL